MARSPRRDLSQGGGMDHDTSTAKVRGQGVPFERVRRITGYLVGTLKRFNNAKRAEERDRVKHATGGALDDKQ